MSKNDYTYNLLVKENKRLLRENEKLKQLLSDLEQYKEEYRRTVDELNAIRKDYETKLNDINNLEKKYEISLEKNFK